MADIIKRFSNPDSSSSRGNSSAYYSNIPKDSSGQPIDFNTPLVFRDWLKYQNAVDPNSQYSIYLQYLIRWYGNSVSSTITTSVVYDSYFAVLESLALVFKDEIRDEWVRELNFENDIDIQDAIEFYARKLKEIALYFINKRNDAQNAKLKYNMTGSERALQNLFTDYLLKAFTKRNYILNLPDQETLRNIPALSAISDNARIIIEPYYDTTNYFDKSPTKDITSYFDTTATNAFISGQNITMDSADIFSSGVLDNQYASDTISDFSGLSSVSDVQNLVLFDEVMATLTQKYTGAIKQQLAIYETLNNVLTTQYDIKEGNNWFYWPSGEYIFEQDNLDVSPIDLINTDLLDNGATAGLTYEEADKIFVTTNNDTTKAAWLKFTPNTTANQTMSAIINPNDRLLFKFPYAGYGDAAETLPWTGPSFSNINATYNFVDDATQKEIEKAYFTNTSEFTALSVTPIDINDSTLLNAGLSAGSTYILSDKITRRNTDNPNRINDTTPSSVYNAILQHSWLYDFRKTNLSLNTGQTNILWPYKSYTTDTSINFLVSSDVCNVIDLSSVTPLEAIKGATAGRGLYDSDIVYKLNGPNSYAIECAYLGGIELSAANLPVTKFTAGIDGVLQPGLNIKCLAGTYATFLWCGANNTSLASTNIKYHAAPADTDYRRLTQKSIYKDRNKTLEQIESESIISNTKDFGDFGVGPGMGNWKADDSRSVLFSPIGHPGDIYDDYGGMADIIFMDWTYPEPFSFDSWRDENGNDYKTSPDFAWYQVTSSSVHPDVGWGPGGWVNYDGTDGFVLKAGYQYKYLRTNLRRSEAELQNNAVPYLVIKETYSYPASSFEWKYAELQQDATWLATTSASTFKLKPGDAILYDHAVTTSYCVSTEDTRGLKALELQAIGRTGDGSYWLDVEAGPLDTIVLANWPSVYYSSVSALPTLLELSAVTWTLQTPLSTKVWENFSPGVPITFALADVGMYYLQASAIELDGSEYQNSAIYFPITSFDSSLYYEATGALSYGNISYNNLAIDAAITLNGWDETTASYTGANTGRGKPFWAKAYNTNDSFTKNKGVSIYGNNLGFTNEYNKKVQPEIDSWNLEANNVIDVEHIGGQQVTWVQPIETQSDDASTEWKELLFSDITSPLNSFSQHDLTHLSISATDNTSDIALTPYTKTCAGAVFINYFAQNDFTWSQPLSTYFTGTITIVNSAVDLKPITPYAYLTNRHYPTMAVLPDVSNLVSVKDTGIFRPQLLGFNNFYSKSHVASLSTTTSISGVYLDISNYETDYGFTLETNFNVMGHLEYDAQWMKKGITTIARSGQITNPSRYQKFTPYINSSEYKIIDNSTINNETDPWYGDLDKTWRDEEAFPIDFRGQETIETWYSETLSPTGELYQFCDDVYGNKYYLFKDIEGYSLYDQRSLDGSLWVKTIDNKFGTANKMLPNVLDNYIGRSYAPEISGGQVRDIYCYADIFTAVLSGAVLFEKIQFNYNDGTLYSIVDDSNVIELSGNLFGDIHCNLENKYLYTIISNATTCFEIYKLNIDQTKLTKVFPTSKTDNLSLLASVSALPSVSIDAPIMSYNKYIDSYNVSFFANASSGQHLISVNLNENYDHFDITKVDIVEPTA